MNVTMDDPDAKYVCTMDAECLAVAKEEVLEVPGDRMGSVKAFRQWIKSQPHIKCKTDTQMLLWFLRGAKFSQLRARELLQNYLRMFNIGDWFRNIDTHDPDVLAYIKSGMMLVLPKRDKQHRQLVILRPAAVHPSDKFYCCKNELRAGFLLNNITRYDETTQVYGQVLLVDFSGYTLKHLRGMPLEDSRKQSKVWQDCTPGRVKAFYFYNVGPLLDGLMAVMKLFMKKKFYERIRVHHSMEGLYKHIPMECLPDEYLPDDYRGPTAGTIQQLTDKLMETVSAPDFRAKILAGTSEEYRLDDSGQEPLAQSFRRLDVD